MNRQPALLPLLAVLAAPALSWAGVSGKVLSVQGQAAQQKSGGVTQTLKVGDEVVEGALLMTGSTGRMQIQLLDGSVLNLGPSSSLKLDSPSNLKISSVTVLKGQLKTSVPPAPSPSGRAKFLVRTRSAVMGVRGTEFTVIFNPENEVTSVVTFEGSVGMAKNGVPDSLKGLLAMDSGNSNLALVNPGRFSTLSPQSSFPTLPQKISPTQLESLRREPGTGGLSLKTHGVLFIPPGLDPRSASTRPLGDLARPSTTENDPRDAPPEGVISKSGPSAPAAGGYLDLKTGLYVPPPPGSAFDPQAGIYIPPASFGSVDPKSGEYLPPTGFVLDPKKGFVADGTVRPSSTTPGAPPQPTLGLPMSAGGLVATDSKNPLPPPQPLIPVNDPFCPNCVPPPPPPPPPQNTTRVQFNITSS